MDTLTPAQRSAVMAKVRSKDTKPEMVVRKLVYSMGYRYKLHVRELPGIPDLVFTGRHKIIFIHGCYWHRHSCKSGQRLPKSRVEFWTAKLEENKKRDKRNAKALRKMGWKILTVWECQLDDVGRLKKRLHKFLEPKFN